MVQRLNYHDLNHCAVLFGKYIPEDTYKGYETVLIAGDMHGNVFVINESALVDVNPIIPVMRLNSIPEAVHEAKKTWDLSKTKNGKYIQV